MDAEENAMIGRLLDKMFPVRLSKCRFGARVTRLQSGVNEIMFDIVGISAPGMPPNMSCHNLTLEDARVMAETLGRAIIELEERMG